MKIIEKSSFDILSPQTMLPVNTPDSDNKSLKEAFVREAKLIELAGRTAYKSEDKITEDSYIQFINNIRKRDHGAVLEFGSMMVKFICDRGVSHELVRHRLCSFLQSSTRYCNYSLDKFGNEITVIRPSTWESWDSNSRTAWVNSMAKSEEEYLAMLAAGRQPQEARAVLPNSLMTEIMVRTNFREWLKIFSLRCDKAAHPDIRALLIPLYKTVHDLLPCVFTIESIDAIL